MYSYVGHDKGIKGHLSVVYIVTSHILYCHIMSDMTLRDLFLIVDIVTVFIQVSFSYLENGPAGIDLMNGENK